MILTCSVEFKSKINRAQETEDISNILTNFETSHLVLFQWNNHSNEKYNIFWVQNDKLVDFDHVLFSLSLKLVEHKKLEYISDILNNFQISTWFSFRDISILTRNMTYFECKWQISWFWPCSVEFKSKINRAQETRGHFWYSDQFSNLHLV